MHARAADGMLPGRDESLALVEVRTSAEEALRGAHELALTDVEADVLITLAGLDEASGDRDAALDRLTSRVTLLARVDTTAPSCAPSTTSGSCATTPATSPVRSTSSRARWPWPSARA